MSGGGKILRFMDWHREKWWIKFDAGRHGRIIGIETWQWYKVPPGSDFDPTAPPIADKLEITGMVRLEDGRELPFSRLGVYLEGELAEKLVLIQRECEERGIPVVRKIR